MDYDVGEVFESCSSGKFEIIRYGEDKSKRDIRFLDTGYVVKNVCKYNIKKGAIKDHNKTIEDRKKLYLGKKFNKLEIIDIIRIDGKEGIFAECICECGKITKNKLHNITCGLVKSCGCIHKTDLVGNKFGEWEVIGVSSDKTSRKYICKCSCGNISEILTSNLTSGKTKSCGCKRLVEFSSRKNKKLYDVLYGMLLRCENTNHRFYKEYGERGIKVCDEWHEFENFYKWAITSGYEEGLTIDRIDVNGNYEPSNCRWETWMVQANNKRNNVRVELRGEYLTIPEIARKYGFNRNTVKSRYFKGARGEQLIRPLR